MLLVQSAREAPDETGSVADAPGAAIVMASECRDSEQGTLVNIRRWRVNPRSKSKVCYKPSHSIMLGEGVFAYDLWPPGRMCKLDCPWLSPYLIVSLCRWFVTSQEQPVLANIRQYCWEPGGTWSTVGFPQERTPALCRGFALEFIPALINRPSDHMSRYRLLCVLGGDEP